MLFNELSNDQRRLQVNIVQVYKATYEAGRTVQKFKGGMRWKRTGDKEYLFKTSGGKGYGKSLGARSPETQKIFDHFHIGKLRAKKRYESLSQELAKLSSVAVAYQIGRVPRVAANIIRHLDNSNLLGKGVSVVGTHALYAYEAQSGVILDSSILQTMDVDLLLDSRKRIKLSSQLDPEGLMGIIKKVDPSFELTNDGGYRAINDKGFMVELVKAIPNPPFKMDPSSIGDHRDLSAAEVEGFNWMLSGPVFESYAISDNGMPVRMVVPDPRMFAFMKVWLSKQESREPLKRPRDYEQARAAAQIAGNYLNMDFNDKGLMMLPDSVRSATHEIQSFLDEHEKEKISDMDTLFKI